ncbi:hypothetical protein C1646_774560 [Rhizophagus diaphanus]|nr:hypothetical protein C1646_774560 [Rhizophagus diaphanus] [Rhizophagus sp. MUCL 43196]
MENAEYHATTNKKKYLFWNEIAEKINDQENTNYFTGEACHKKFLGLTKAFYTAEKFKERTGDKRSLVVGEKIYEEFSSKFWVKPELSFGRARSGSVRGSSRASSSSRSSISRTSNIMDLFETSPLASRLVTPSVETSASSRPTTPTLPLFLKVRTSLMSILIMVVIPKESVQTSRIRLNTLFFWDAKQRFFGTKSLSYICKIKQS